MKRLGRWFAVFCMILTVLAGTASANSAAPDYLVVVKVENGPEEPYSVELLKVWPDGEADEQFQMEDTEKENSYRLRGMDVPKRFRVRIVTQSGECWESEMMERETLQMGVRVDWGEKTAKIPPVWAAIGLQFLSTLLPTLVFEGLVLVLFGYEWKKNWKAFLLVNLLTQGALALYLAQGVVRGGWNAYSAAIYFLLLLVPAEVVIVLVEAGVYRRFLQGHSKGRAVGYAVTANLVSYAAGGFVVQAVWENITRVLWLGM